MGASFGVVLLLAILQIVATLPPQILFHRSETRADGYQFEYTAEDGSRRQEVATLIYRDKEAEPVLHVKGVYEYFDGDGRKYVVRYQADDRGTRREGDVVPPKVKN